MIRTVEQVLTTQLVETSLDPLHHQEDRQEETSLVLHHQEDLITHRHHHSVVLVVHSVGVKVGLEQAHGEAEEDIEDDTEDMVDMVDMAVLTAGEDHEALHHQRVNIPKANIQKVSTVIHQPMAVEAHPGVAVIAEEGIMTLNIRKVRQVKDHHTADEAAAAEEEDMSTDVEDGEVTQEDTQEVHHHHFQVGLI